MRTESKKTPPSNKATAKTPNVLHFSPEPQSNTRLANLCGPMNENIRQIASALSVDITLRSNKFIISGPAALKALNLLEQFYAISTSPVSVDDIQLALVEQSAIEASLAKGVPASVLVESELTSPTLKTRRTDLRARTPMQVEYLKTILRHDITFGIGPAGTGKTYLAVACAVDALEREAMQRVILTRPAVEAGERLGFLPGDLAQKVDPYLRPLYDALYDLLGFERTMRFFEKQVLEIAPLAYMRGRTLNNAFIILDEAQNTTPEQMKMFLTRIGFGSRAVITGDITQIDLPSNQKSGLVEAVRILENVHGIGFVRFSSIDIVRHPLIARIVDAYERELAAEKKNSAPARNKTAPRKTHTESE